MSEYGFNVTEGDVKKTLLEKNRGYNQRNTWSQQFLKSNIAASQATSAVTTDFSETLNAAYNASLANQTAIAGSTLGQGYREALIEANKASLASQYSKLKTDIQDKQINISNLLAENVQKIDFAAGTQAKNLVTLHDAHFDYLNKLYETQPELFENPAWAKYTVYDEQLGSNRLKTKSELMNPAEEQVLDKAGNVIGTDQLGMYDKEGNLTTKGADFFDQLLNQNDTNYTIGTYLSETNPELYNWLKDYNPYDYNKSFSNLGSFKNMVGLTSLDDTYSFVERFGGLSTKEIDSMFTKFKHSYENLSNSYAKNKGKNVIQDVEGLTNSLQTMAKQLGIDAEFDFSKLNDTIATGIQQSRTKGEMTKDWFDNATGFVTGGAGAGAVAGSIIAPIMAASGTGAMLASGAAVAMAPIVLKLAIAGAVVGLGAAIVDSSIDTEQQRKENKKQAELVTEAYDNLLASMTIYAHETRQNNKTVNPNNLY